MILVFLSSSMGKIGNYKNQTLASMVSIEKLRVMMGISGMQSWIDFNVLIYYYIIEVDSVVELVFIDCALLYSFSA